LGPGGVLEDCEYATVGHDGERVLQEVGNRYDSLFGSAVNHAGGGMDPNEIHKASARAFVADLIRILLNTKPLVPNDSINSDHDSLEQREHDCSDHKGDPSDLFDLWMFQSRAAGRGKVHARCIESISSSSVEKALGLI
jgi:hypothetical protein